MDKEQEIQIQLQEFDALNVNAVAGLCGDLERLKGWREGGGRSFGEIIALIHSEASEALEEHRDGHEVPYVYHETENRVDGFRLMIGDPVLHKPNTKPEGIPIELADIIIRILAFCEKEGIDIMEAIRLKMLYNLEREERHGGKQI